MNPRFPVYIISKGRWEYRKTVKALDQMRVPYRIVVEPQEYQNYAAVIDPARILTLPFSNLGQGSIPARNWVWEHSIAEGHAWHWILDDNIESFKRYNHNMKVICLTGTPFYIIEDFVLRYENVGQAGMNYEIFCPDTESRPPVLFNAFLIEKITTMKQRGGNTDTIYNTGDRRLAFAKSLAEQHPDVASVTQKFGRWHHNVNYEPFARNTLIRRPGPVYSGTNNYGMTIQEAKK